MTRPASGGEAARERPGTDRPNPTANPGGGRSEEPCLSTITVRIVHARTLRRGAVVLTGAAASDPRRPHRLSTGRRSQLGRRRPVRVRRQLEHQHRQRLLRRPAVRQGTWEAYGGLAVRPARRPGQQGCSRSPSPSGRSSVRAGRVAHLRGVPDDPITGLSGPPHRPGTRRCPGARPGGTCGSPAPAPAPRSAPASESGSRTPSNRGDTLAGIAARYGTEGGWQALYAMNSDRISNPNRSSWVRRSC